jgi:hypothetical protein
MKVRLSRYYNRYIAVIEFGEEELDDYVGSGSTIVDALFQLASDAPLLNHQRRALYKAIADLERGAIALSMEV